MYVYVGQCNSKYYITHLCHRLLPHIINDNSNNKTLKILIYNTLDNNF